MWFVDRLLPRAGQAFRPDLPSRIPSLDGLRAISIAMVLLGHLVGTRNFPASLAFTGHLAAAGVRVFFVISGFLITGLLLKEWDKTAQISLKQFYLRRVFRIFPAFYLYVGVVLVLVWQKVVAVLPGDLLHALTYTMNYHHPHSWILAHLWSLAVEEQFYLIWPALLLLAAPRRAMKAAAAVLLLAPFIRLGTWQFFPSVQPYYGQEFEAVADALASGCLLAGAYNTLGTWTRYQRLLRSPAFWVVPAVLVATQYSGAARLMLLAGQSLMNLCIVLIIERMVRYPDTFSGRLLNLAPVRWVGVLSYSLYLWQQCYLNRHSDTWATAFPVNLILAVVTATASYYVVERPFLKLKERLSAPKNVPMAVAS